MAKKKESLMTAVSEEIKSSFNLDKFKEKKLLNSTNNPMLIIYLCLNKYEDFWLYFSLFC